MRMALPFTKKKIEDIIRKYPTPFYIYDEKGIRKRAREFLKSFSILPGFKNYFAVKACPNPYILKILREEKMGVDCSSLPELVMAEKVGFKGEEIMFSSNNTPPGEFKKARELGAIINLDDISFIEDLEREAGIPKLVCLRYNPGEVKKIGKNPIGKPKEAKFGMTKEQVFSALKILREKGAKRFALHTMVVSNELREEVLSGIAKLMFELALEVKKRIGIEVEFINLGGGIGIPYRENEKEVDFKKLAQRIFKFYQTILLKNNLSSKIVMECGRTITGPFGFLITKVIHKKHTYKDYIGVDTSVAHLIRPAMYGAYHHITVLGKEKKRKTKIYDVVGSLCENNDKLAINRRLPKIEINDILVIHNAGAHSFAMSFNYNGKLRPKELLLRERGKVEEIRRAETIKDYFATLDFSKL